MFQETRPRENSLNNQNGKNKPNHMKTLIIHKATWQLEDFE